jgi:hypothetical protein
LAAAWLGGQTVPPTPAAPQKKADAAARPAPARHPAAPSYKDLKYPALKPIPIPPVETVTLPNGMRLFH